MNHTTENSSRQRNRRGPHTAIIVCFVVAVISSFGSIAFAQTRRIRTRSWFSYNKAATLDFKEESVTLKDGVQVRDVSYAAYTKERGRIQAYVISPVGGTGNFAGILFFHWLGEPNGDRNEFLNEAIDLAKKGTVSVLIQGHFPWKVQPSNGETDRQRVIDETIEVRRALDLLLSQKMVDPKRIGYVGHDYGAMYGSILSGIDRRVKAFVFVAGMGDFAPWSLKYWQEPGTNGVEAYRRGMKTVDPIGYVGRAAPASLMFQFSNADKYISRTTALAYYDAASRPKQIHWYETDHAMNLDSVRKDRADWLARRLRLSK